MLGWGGGWGSAFYKSKLQRFAFTSHYLNIIPLSRRHLLDPCVNVVNDIEEPVLIATYPRVMLLTRRPAF
jgi:hypothetical protein